MATLKEKYKKMLQGVDNITLNRICSMVYPLTPSRQKPLLGKEDSVRAGRMLPFIFPLDQRKAIQEKMDSEWEINIKGKVNTKNIEAFTDALDELLDENRTGNKKDERFVLFLESDGRFWHTNEKKHCYAVDPTSNRFLLLKYLTQNKGFHSIDILASILNAENKQNLRTEIGKIRNNIHKFLGLKGSDVIKMKIGFGYGISSTYPIIFHK